MPTTGIYLRFACPPLAEIPAYRRQASPPTRILSVHGVGKILVVMLDEKGAR